jgi:hypothetical protein
MSNPSGTPGTAGPSADVESEINATAANATQSRALVQTTDSRTDADRSRIARLIINVFVGALLAVLILFVVQGYATNSWSLASSQATDLLKTTLLPVVTLVLGYYFGQANKS